MVQEFNVLRCFSCRIFQVHQVKKAKKWVCKVCAEKQSTKKIHGQGSAPDCRKHVQKLNSLQGHFEQLKGEKAPGNENDDVSKATFQAEEQHESINQGGFIEASSVSSKWQKYIERGDSEDTYNTSAQELWHGVPITTDSAVFQGFNKTKHNKRKRQQNNRDEPRTYTSCKRQNNSTYQASPSKSQIKNDSNSEFAFSNESAGENLYIGLSNQVKWGKFQRGTDSKSLRYPATCPDTAAQEGNFLFTKKQMNGNMVASSFPRNNFQLDMPSPFMENCTKAKDVSITDKQINKNRKAHDSEWDLFQTKPLMNDMVQIENLSVTGYQMTKKEIRKVRSKWDKFQTVDTQSYDSDQNEDGVWAFSTNEKKIDGKENTIKMASKWDKYQNHPSSSEDNDDESNTYDTGSYDCGGNENDYGGDDADNDSGDGDNGVNDIDDGGNDDNNHGDGEIPCSQKIVDNDRYGHCCSSGSASECYKTGMLIAHQANENNNYLKVNSRSKWDKFQTSHSLSFAHSVSSNDNTLQLRNKQINENSDGNITSKWSQNQRTCQSNSKYNLVQDCSHSKADLLLTRNETGISLSVYSLRQQGIAHTKFGMDEKQVTNNKKKGGLGSKNIFQIDEKLEGDWWII